MKDLKAPRVLMFCQQFYPLIGGAERQAQILGTALIKLGCHVEVLTPQLKKSWPLEETIGELKVNRFRCIDLTRNLLGVRGLGVFNMLLIGFQVERAVSRHILDFDVLHAHIASPMVAYAMKTAQGRRKKVICKIAAGGSSFDFISLRRTSLLGSRLLKKLINAMDRWIAISGEIRSDLQTVGISNDRIVSIPNGVDIPLSVERLASEHARHFLYLGRFTHNPYRDFETLLRAFDIVVSEFPDCKLILVGGGDREGEIRALLDILPHAKARTELVGFSDPRRWLNWADALIHPSLAEGMSNTLLEGMANGVTCIANDIPPNREVLGDGEAGILIPVRNVDALVQAIRNLATIPGKCGQWQQRGRKRAEEMYSIEAVASQYIHLYEQLMREGGA